MLLDLVIDDRGNDDALIAQLFKRYGSMMYYAAYSILQNEQDAEDAVQESFFTIKKYINAIGDPLSAMTKAYVLSVVESQSIKIIRKRARLRERPLKDEMVGKHEEEMIMQNDQIARAILRLPEQYHRVLMLRYYMGFTVDEIAAMLNKSVDAVYQQISRSKRLFAELLREEGIDIG